MSLGHSPNLIKNIRKCCCLQITTKGYTQSHIHHQSLFCQRLRLIITPPPLVSPYWLQTNTVHTINIINVAVSYASTTILSNWQKSRFQSRGRNTLRFARKRSPTVGFKPLSSSTVADKLILVLAQVLHLTPEDVIYVQFCFINCSSIKA